MPSSAIKAQFAEVLVVDPVEFDPENLEVRIAGARFFMSKQEAALLRALMSTPGRIVSREELYHRAWGAAEMPEANRSVDVYVRKLRVRFTEAAPGIAVIHTHHRAGYRFDPEPRRRPRRRGAVAGER